MTTPDYDDFKFYKFRFHLPDGTSAENWNFLRAVILGIRKDNMQEPEYYGTCGYEVLNKVNEPTRPHLHMHFAVKTQQTLGAVRKRLQRHFSEDSRITSRGNELYSLSEEDDVQDVHRFLRYVWKQGGRRSVEHGFAERIPSDMNIEMSIALAREEQGRMWEFNRKKRDEMLKPSTKDGLFEYLDALNLQNPFSDSKQLLIKIMEYYNQEEKSANKQTILGYHQTGLWRYKLESFEETALKWLN